ncbi:MAG: hypothetical protein GSR80_000035 [Desulfurococcales archaeon]|nr:hypothetical protein [Desulfurococcales archaeon]
MALHGLQLVAALLGTGAAGELMEGSSAIPPLEVLDGEFGVVYVDASSRGEPSGLNAYLVKLAILTRLHTPGGVAERILHPLPTAEGGGELPPLLMGRGSENTKQAVVYAVELASLLAVAEAPEAYFGASPPRRLLLVRHGPILQMLSQYLSKPYIIDADDAVNALVYAGLERGRALEILEYTHPCEASDLGYRQNRNKSVLGLLIIRLLEDLVDKARERGYGLAGVVEDTSRSRSLVAAALASLLRARPPARGKTHRDWAKNWAESLRGAAEAVSTEKMGDCLCLERELLGDLLASHKEWEEVLRAVKEVAVTRFTINSIEELLIGGHEGELEASIIWSGVMPDMTDSELLYTLHYLTARKPPFDYPATRELSHSGRLAITRYYLEQKGLVRCGTAEWLERALGKLEAMRYRYLAPSDPPKCDDLAGSRLGLRPCELAELQTVPPAIRLEYLEGMEMLEEAVALTVYPARLVLYGYPPQLLVVDHYSRIKPSEAMAFHAIAGELARRLQPYGYFIRSWERRIASIL